MCKGLVEIHNADERVIFRGRYYDSRTVQPLAGDDTLTPIGQSVVDHFENGFGEGPYAGGKDSSTPGSATAARS
jgi:hypothetical protein